MKKELLEQIYADKRILHYLRYNPRWYKILYIYPDKIKDFMEEAKGYYKIRLSDKLENWQGQLSFLSSLIEYIQK